MSKKKVPLVPKEVAIKVLLSNRLARDLLEELQKPSPLRYHDRLHYAATKLSNTTSMSTGECMSVLSQGHYASQNHTSHNPKKSKRVDEVQMALDFGA